MLKATPSTKGNATAVSSKLCPCSPRTPCCSRNIFLNIVINLLCWSIVATELQGVAYGCVAVLQGAGWQFKHRRSLPKHSGHSKRTQITPNRDDVPRTIENRNIN